MPTVPVDLYSASDIVGFTLALIALMQASVWFNRRERGMLWFAAAALSTAVLVATGGTLVHIGARPSRWELLEVYAVRDMLALGITSYLGMPARARLVAVIVLLLPSVLLALAPLVGFMPGPNQEALPLVWVDLGSAALCLAASRREPGAGHDLLALAPLIGPAIVLLRPWRAPGPHMNHDFPATVIGFGIIVLVVDLMRRGRDSRLAQAHAQRMSNYYAALSRTNQAILRTDDPTALYNEICRICVDSAQAKVACVFTLEDGFIHRAAWAGDDDHLIQAPSYPWELDSPMVQSTFLAGVFRTGEPVIRNDFRREPPAGLWRAIAEEHGVLCAAFLPLRRNGATVAALMMASTETDIFDAALVQLLDEMTGDISFALDNIDRAAQHREAARQVEAGLHRFSRLFEAAPVGASIISLADRRILHVNQAMCERHGMTREQMIGLSTSSLPYAPEPADHEAFYRQVELLGRVRNFTMRLEGGQGQALVELVNAEPIDYLDQPCILLMSLDISELRAAQEARQALGEAQAASRAKTQFLSSMSHELRTPLNAVLGFSSLLRNEAADTLTPQQLAQLGHVQDAGWHLLRLINDVLDLSRIEAGQLGVSVRALALAPLLDEALQMSAPLAAKGDITLHASYRDDPPSWALADPTRLRQVLINVLSNAIKYSRPNGSVQVRTFRDAERMAIEIVDTGLGMSAHQLAHLFEPFNRLGRDGQGIEGTGIGLSLTRQLMELMSGDVEITSQEGLGTRVLLTLPWTKASTSEPPPAPARPIDRAEGAPRGCVLYIEDNEVNILLVEQLLSRWEGVRLVSARDGASGIRTAAELEPDLVLLDLQLPDIDGLEVLRQLRAHPALRGTPVVVLSATAMPADIAQARDRGAADYWTKPLDFQRFLTDISALLPHVS